MPNFQNLRNILDMEFKQLRGLQGAGGARATNDAIRHFVDNLVMFFKQFRQDPTHDELKIYINYMETITTKINESEQAYYLNKYTRECPEYAEEMASGCLLRSFKDLPTRMQYWAASEEHGGAIRNSENHRKAVNNLNRWASLLFPSDQKSLFFKSKHPGDADKQKDVRESQPSPS